MYMEQTQQLSNESLKLAKEEIEAVCQKYEHCINAYYRSQRQ
jgi:hypothetical protein